LGSASGGGPWAGSVSLPLGRWWARSRLPPGAHEERTRARRFKPGSIHARPQPTSQRGPFLLPGGRQGGVGPCPTLRPTAFCEVAVQSPRRRTTLSSASSSHGGRLWPRRPLPLGQGQLLVGDELLEGVSALPFSAACWRCSGPHGCCSGRIDRSIDRPVAVPDVAGRPFLGAGADRPAAVRRLAAWATIPGHAMAMTMLRCGSSSDDHSMSRPQATAATFKALSRVYVTAAAGRAAKTLAHSTSHAPTPPT